MKYLIANWKAHKTIYEVDAWIRAFSQLDASVIKGNLEIIICPPYPFIYYLKDKLQSFPFCKIGAQDISYFGRGAYTGEVPSEALSGIVDYVIIGHSERRYYFEETSEILFQKNNRAIQQKISPIFCIRDSGDLIPPKAQFVAYEPIVAIGTGKNESVENVLAFKKRLHLDKTKRFIYGGSVNENTISEYARCNEIDGFLIGSASLYALHLIKMMYHILPL